jgi:hypothetical protein
MREEHLGNVLSSGDTEGVIKSLIIKSLRLINTNGLIELNLGLSYNIIVLNQGTILLKVLTYNAERPPEKF